MPSVALWRWGRRRGFLQPGWLCGGFGEELGEGDVSLWIQDGLGLAGEREGDGGGEDRE